MDARNYLAHRWLRERAIHLHDPAADEVFGEDLAEINRRMDALDERMEAHKRNLGIVDLTDADIEALGLESPPSFDGWAKPSESDDRPAGSGAAGRGFPEDDG